jgi:hypothetical protein
MSNLNVSATKEMNKQQGKYLVQKITTILGKEKPRPASVTNGVKGLSYDESKIANGVKYTSV